MMVCTSVTHAQQIMDINFIEVDEVCSWFEFKPTNYHMSRLTEVPFTQNTLEQYSDSHILVPVLPLSICDIQGVLPHLFSREYLAPCIKRGGFMHETGSAKWQLIRKEFVPDSTRKTWREQLELVPSGEEIPSARVVLFALIACRLIQNKHMFGGGYARSINTVTQGTHAGIGFMGSQWVDINDWSDLHISRLIGLASKVKYPT
jgi:hypothetical protein